MPRKPILLAITLMVLVGSSVASGASTTNTTLTATIAEATWSSYDEKTGGGEFGAVQVARYDGVTTALLERSIGELVLCEGGGTPDPTDDFYGFVGKEISGTGPATLAVGRGYTSAKASGTVTAEVVTFNECTGDMGTTVTRTYKISIDVQSVSPLIRQSTLSKIRIPSEMTARALVRGVLRQAAGSVKVGLQSIEADAFIGQLTLRSHSTLH
jgi:hypothetical protein